MDAIPGLRRSACAMCRIVVALAILALDASPISGANAAGHDAPQAMDGRDFVLDPRDRAQESKLIDAVSGLMSLVGGLDEIAPTATGIDEMDRLGEASLRAATSSADAYLGHLRSAEGRAALFLDEIERQISALRYTPGRDAALAALVGLRKAVSADLDAREAYAREWAEVHQRLLVARPQTPAGDEASPVAWQAAEALQRLREPSEVAKESHESFSQAIGRLLEPLLGISPHVDRPTRQRDIAPRLMGQEPQHLWGPEVLAELSPTPTVL